MIVDQIDAVSEISGRTGTVKDILRRIGSGNPLLRERQMSSGVPQLRSGERSPIPRAGTRTPSEAGAGAGLYHGNMTWHRSSNVPESQRRALQKASGDYCPFPSIFPSFIEIGDPTFDFTTGTELMQRLLEKKTRELTKDRNVGWNVQAPLYTNMAEWMSDKQELSCPDSVLDDFDGCKRLAVLGRSDRR